LTDLPAIALAAVPGRRSATLDVAREIEKRGFAGIYCASFGDALALCEALCFATERIPFGTAIVNIYLRHVTEYASHASFIHELSGGRFRLGVGVSHGPMNKRYGVETGAPLGDMREFVSGLRGAGRVGELPPIVLAGMRRKMVALAAEIGQGLVFANAARSHVPESLGALGATSDDFFVGDMIPVCVSDDRQAAMARNRKTLVMYLGLPNYRNYWKEAGYVEEMEAAEAALARGEKDLTKVMSDRWLADVTLFGTASEVRDGVAAWREAGVSTPILVPSSASGGQFEALRELFEVFGD
jgi:alkanesulfonate monooxygenase SsuD/methylene tetrahydromethanopterin reductase-like flavin-dependent oxidoreductase (luciferase family)